MRYPLIAALLLIGLIGASATAGQRMPRPPIKGHGVLVTIRADCGESRPYPRRLRRGIQHAILHAYSRPVAITPDIAFPYDLNSDGRPEYFVPLGCGATGNCSWGILSSRSGHVLATFTAWLVYVTPRRGGWFGITTYTREGVNRGIIEQYRGRAGRYLRVSQRTETLYGSEPSPFFQRMGLPECSGDAAQLTVAPEPAQTAVNPLTSAVAPAR